MSATKSSLTALTLGAIGVVYGDIGTSVLYAVKEVFGSGHVEFTHANVYGVLSILFWTLTVIVSLKYVVLVLRADNHGEGGLIAMLALASTAVKDRPELRQTLLAIGIFGTALFYGDGVITPAISVLSAVEGLEVISPAFRQYVVPITLVVLFALFAFFKYTSVGLAMRAAAQNPDSAKLVGIRVSWMLGLGWGLAAAIGAVAGMMVAPIVFLDPNMMAGILLYGFAGALLGGIDNPPAAVLGGLVVGVLENLLGAYVIGTELKLTVALVLIVGTLTLRPDGLFGKKVVTRV